MNSLFNNNSKEINIFPRKKYSLSLDLIGSWLRKTLF